MTSTTGRQMSMDEFADHDGGGRGPKTEYLDWREKGSDGDGSVQVWMVDEPWMVWRFSFNRVTRFKKDGEEVEKLRMFNWNCMEGEDLIKKIKRQGYYRDSDREIDERITAPVDPFFRLLEWMYRSVMSQEVDWLDRVFAFEPEDGDDKFVHAGGMLGMYPKSWDDVDKDEIKEMKEAFKEAKVSLKESYKERSTVGLNYIFAVVKNDKPQDGPRVAIEKEALGNAVKKLYKDRVLGFKGDKRKAQILLSQDDDGARGLCMTWAYDDTQEFSKKYNVIGMPDERPSDAVLEQLEKYRAEPPEMDHLVGQHNVAQLRQVFEEHWCHKVKPPWDEIFEPAMKALAGTEYVKLPESFDHGANAPASSGTSAPPKSDTAKEKEYVHHPNTVPCEACGKDMPDSVMTCPHCNAKYAEFLGFVGLAFVPCEACGKARSFEEEKCMHCGREYELSADQSKIQLKPLPPPPDSKPEVRASRRRQPAADSKS